LVKIYNDENLTLFIFNKSNFLKLIKIIKSYNNYINFKNNVNYLM